jgi:hypothetical protein
METFGQAGGSHFRIPGYYPCCISLFGQFPFFWNYEKKILKWMLGIKSKDQKVEVENRAAGAKNDQ